MTAPTTLRPLPRQLGSCPAGHGPLEPQAIHHPGGRPLLRGRCPSCRHVFLQDVAGADGLPQPCSLDLATGETHGDQTTAAWRDGLRAYYEQPDAGAVEVTVDERAAHAGPALLLDCLDIDRQRALRTLRSADAHRGERCVALVPRALHALVPEHVGEVWVVDADARRRRSWLLELDRWVQERLDAFSDGVSLSAPPPDEHDDEAGLAAAQSAVSVVAARTRSIVAARAARARSIARTAGILSRRGLSRARARRVALPTVMTDARGARFELVDRTEVAQFFEHRGHFEGAELDLLKRYLHPGDSALDVGANIGHFTATIGLAVGPEGRVHAFEPLAANRERLGRTLQLNGIEPRVHVEPAAVTAEPGEIEIVDYGEGYGSWATTKPAEHDLRGERSVEGTAISVAAVTLDEHCSKHGIDHVAALKVDVEGAEMDVLDGAEAFLAAGAADLLIVECSDATLVTAGTSSWELADRLGRGRLRTYALSRGRLTPHRTVGWTPFSNVVALSPAGRERLGV
ncbi:MAG: hypothetical protein QOE31_656 [Solirubrobacteraceae bacterium]|nr:hypothetical protein [Solirubrobacteraceae bacterium]